MTALATLAAAVARATPARAEDEKRLREAAQLLNGEKLLTVSAVAQMLGVSSPTTIHNWLEKGYFPGAIRTAGGQRRFLLKDVLTVRVSIAKTNAENRSGKVTIPDLGDEDPYA